MKHHELMAALDQLADKTERGDASAMRPGLAPDLEHLLSDAFAAEGHGPEPSLAEIAAYVDGALHGAELDAFEAALVASPELRAEVEMLGGRLEMFDGATSDRLDEASPTGLRANVTRGVALSQEQQHALFRDPALRADYNRLIKTEGVKPPPRSAMSFSVATLPARIAASTDRRVSKRDFAGGTISIGSAGRPHLVLIRIRLDAKIEAGTGLALRGADGSLAYIPLPPPGPEGSITKILDLRNPSDAEASELIGDPMSTGDFVVL